MPPAEGNEYRVPGAEFRLPGMAQRFGVARKSRVIGARELNEAHGSARRREVERGDVEIGELLRRKQREPPAAPRDTGDVVDEIEMGVHLDGVADPHARLHARIEQRHRVRAGEAR